MPLPTRRPILLTCLLAACALPGVLLADDASRPVETEVEAALQNLAAHNALGRAGTPLTVSRPAQVRYELGAVVDVRKPAPQGLEILAVTPDSAAARLGLKAGDRLLAVNGKRFDRSSPAGDVLKDALQAGNGRLQVLASRNGARIEASGTADVIGLPAYALTIGGAAGQAPGCGFVSYNHLPPRSDNVFPAIITTIDGRSTPLGEVNRLRVEGGRHVLTVQEFIPDHRLSATQNRQRYLMKRERMARAYKPLVVDIRPGTNYRIGARLRKDRLDRASVRANEYWEPVVWEQVEEQCR